MIFSKVDFIICIAFLAVLILVGNWQNYSAKNAKQFLVSEQKTGYFALTATLVMTTINTGLLLSFSSLGYCVGLWSLSLPLIFLLGLMFYTLTVAKYWRHYDQMTAAHYFVDRFGKKIAGLSATILFIAMIGFSAVYIKSLALIFKSICNIPIDILSIIITITVLLIVFRGGLKSVIRTDILSLFGMLLLLFAMAYGIYFMPVNNYSPVSLSVGVSLLSPAYVFSLFILTVFSYILSPSYSQKLVAAKTPLIAKRAVFLAAILIYIIYAIGIAICYMLKLKGISIYSSDTVFPEAMALSLSTGWLGLGYGILFSIGATTLTSAWTGMVSLLPLMFNVNFSHRTSSMICFCAGSSLVIAVYGIDSLLEKIILANIPIVALSFALLGGIYWEKTSNAGVSISIVNGCIGAGLCYWYFGEKLMYTWYWAVYVVPLIFLSGILGSILFPDKEFNENNDRIKLIV